MLVDPLLLYATINFVPMSLINNKFEGYRSTD